MKSIYVQPNEVWAECKKISQMGNSTELIAEYPDAGVEIYLNTVELSGRHFPEIEVQFDGESTETETCYSEYSCKDTVSKFYDIFLDDQNLIAYVEEELFAEDKSDDEVERIDTASVAIEVREDELNLAFTSLMQVVAEDSVSDYPTKEMIEDLKEHVLEYMYRKHGLEIYRPMIIQYEDGTEEYMEYPYESLEFENEGSPVYK